MTTKKQGKRNMTAAESRAFTLLIGKARVFAYKKSRDPKLTAQSRRAFASAEKKLWNISNNFPLGD